MSSSESPSGARLSDERFMREAIALAERGRGRVEPNPMVGAICVCDGVVVGRGYHADYGGPHAEIHALREAGERARGATLYVSLEPCSTTQKTPPCTEAILSAGCARVVAATTDDNPRHGGRGLMALKEAGVRVDVGVLEEEARALIAGFVRFLAGDRPYVVAKWAQTLDGRIATRSGDARWISCEASRRDVHRERARCDAILVGRRTVAVDDPRLTTRLVPGRSPRRVVLDSRLSLSHEHALFATAESPTIVLCTESAPREAEDRLMARGVRVERLPADDAGRVALDAALRRLRAGGVGRLLVEGGATVHGTFLQARAVDRVVAYVAPRILGDPSALGAVEGGEVAAMSAATELRNVEYEVLARDVRVAGELDKDAY